MPSRALLLSLLAGPALGAPADVTDVIVRLHATAADVLESVRPNAPRAEVYEALTEHASLTQKRVAQSLAAAGASFQSLWIENAVAVTAASPAVLRELRALPEVASVEPERTLRLPELEAAGAAGAADAPAATPQDNIATLNTAPLWAAGATGTGVVVATIDSGVRWTHEALRDNYRGFGARCFDFPTRLPRWSMSSLHWVAGVKVVRSCCSGRPRRGRPRLRILGQGPARASHARVR